MKDVLNKIMISTNVQNMMKDTKKRKSVIVFDEVESVSAPAEKNYLQTLQKLNEAHWYCPIIFIANTKHNKLLKTLKDSSFFVKFTSPSYFDLKVIFIKIAKKEKIRVPTAMPSRGVNGRSLGLRSLYSM